MRAKHHAKIKNGTMKINDRPKLNEDIRGRKDGDYYFVLKEVEPTIQDSLRRYYFSQVLTLISEETGILSKDDLHLNMKIKFASYVDDRTGLTVVYSIFSDESPLAVSIKRKFIKQVKQWGFEFLNITFPEKGEAEGDF